MLIQNRALSTTIAAMIESTTRAVFDHVSGKALVAVLKLLFAALYIIDMPSYLLIVIPSARSKLAVLLRQSLTFLFSRKATSKMYHTMFESLSMDTRHFNS